MITLCWAGTEPPRGGTAVLSFLKGVRLQWAFPASTGCRVPWGKADGSLKKGPWGQEILCRILAVFATFPFWDPYETQSYIPAAVVSQNDMGAGNLFARTMNGVLLSQKHTDCLQGPSCCVMHFIKGPQMLLDHCNDNVLMSAKLPCIWSTIVCWSGVWCYYWWTVIWKTMII